MKSKIRCIAFDQDSSSVYSQNLFVNNLEDAKKQYKEFVNTIDNTVNFRKYFVELESDTDDKSIEICNQLEKELVEF